MSQYQSEEWKAIPCYEKIYEVSDKGRVRTAEGKTTISSLHGKRVWQQRVLKQKTDKLGYKRVCLWKNKAPKTVLVHRLVAMAFIDKVKGKNFINHIDGNPSNNYKENLEWCTSKENLDHAYRTGLNQAPDPTVLVNTISQEAFYFMSKAQASKFLGRNHGFISLCLKRGISQVDEFQIYVKPNFER